MSTAAPTARILVAEDDRGLLRLIEQNLKREGYTVLPASSGREVVPLLRRSKVDLLFLDRDLGDTDAEHLIAELETEGLLRPFVIVTGQGDERVAVEMMKRGALDYVVKDAMFLDLLPAVVRKAVALVEKDNRLVATEAALHREHEMTSALLDTTAAVVVVMDPDGHIVRMNRACTQLSGYTLDEVRGQVLWRLFPTPVDCEDINKEFEKLRLGGQASSSESNWVTRGGDRRTIAWSNTVLRNAAGVVEYLVATGIDITERRRLEREILHVRESEQQRIGRDLHDGLGQQLAGIGLMCQVLEQRLAGKSKADARHAGEIAGHVREAIVHSRRLARGLSPVELDAGGLMTALKEMAANIESMFRVQCVFRCDLPVPIEDNATAIHLFRIAQEAVSNAVRHGKPKKVEIALRGSTDRLILAVEDDGVGLPAGKTTGQGMGLRIMEYRAGLIGGTLVVQRTKDQKTVVVCTVRRAKIAAAGKIRDIKS